LPFLRRPNAEIYFEVHGDGPDLMFLHGAGGNGASWWEQVSHFSQNYRCIVADNRYFGRSRAEIEDSLDADSFLDDAVALLDQLSVEQVGLVCQSLGGWTGLRLALNFPRRVWGLVSSNSPMGIDLDTAVGDIKRFSGQKEEQTMAIEIAALSEQFRRESPDLFLLYKQIGSFNTLAKSEINGRPFFSALTSAVLDPDFLIPPADLESLLAPILLIGGTHDPLYSATTARSVAELFNSSRLHIFEEVGHSPYFETPKQFNSLVDEFLSKCLQERIGENLKQISGRII